MSKKTKILSNLRALTAVCILTSATFLGAFAPSMAQLVDGNLEPDISYPPFTIQASLSKNLSAGQVGKHKLPNALAMRVFYQKRDNKPYWNDKRITVNRAEELLSALEKSWTHGLNPEKYNATRLRDLMTKASYMKQAEMELLLTDSFVSYVRDLSGMRVDSKGLRTDERSWKKQLSAENVLFMLGSDQSAAKIVANVVPKSKTYRTLQGELIRLSEEPEEDYVSILPIFFDGLLRPGERHNKVPAIRMRLGLTQQGGDKYRYDDRLAGAVIKFQRQHSLDDDGIIGSNTLTIMNRTKLDQMHQIIANLERLRWAEEARPEKFVIVNIPSATLWAIDDNRVEFEMDVIVGKPVRPTESFVTSIDGIRFNPDWTVPSTIKRFDMLPKLKADPGYFANKGIELFDGPGRNAQTIDPTSVDWNTISRAGLNKLRMVQTPGDHNALGRIRVLMQNKFNIYLHDTNHPELFEQAQYRHLSSGCIRLRDPHKMAKFVMQDKRGWSHSAMNEVLDTLETTDIRLERSIPVYIMYYTTWIDEEGRVVYGPDVYKQDRKLIEKLSNIDGFSIPGHNAPRLVRSDRSKIASAQ